MRLRRLEMLKVSISIRIANKFSRLAGSAKQKAAKAEMSDELASLLTSAESRASTYSVRTPVCLSQGMFAAVVCGVAFAFAFTALILFHLLLRHQLRSESNFHFRNGFFSILFRSKVSLNQIPTTARPHRINPSTLIFKWLFIWRIQERKRAKNPPQKMPYSFFCVQNAFII